MYSLDAKAAALGWAFHVTKHIDNPSPRIYFERETLVINADSKVKANSISKRIHTDPSYKSSSFKYLLIRVMVGSKVWDEFTLAEIQSVLASREGKCQFLVLQGRKKAGGGD